MSAAMQSRREVPIVLSPAKRPVSTEGCASARSATGTATTTVQVKKRRRSAHRSKRKNGAPIASIVTVRYVVVFWLPYECAVVQARLATRLSATTAMVSAKP
jgi:hypothetical protein